jgi:hypothetical protein
MSKSSEAVKLWRKRTKARINDALGGKCVCCGYDRFLNALECHHLDRSTKKFTVGSVRANSISWEAIVNELKKCVLLCSNCHREVEGGVLTIPSNAKRFDETFSNYEIHFGTERRVTAATKGTIDTLLANRKYRKENTFCLECGTQIFGGWRRKYCSRKCTSVGKTDDPRVAKDVLWKDVTTMNIESVGRKYGVTGTAIKKWLRKYGLPARATDIKKMLT